MAEYVLAHQFRVATMTIDEFAAAVGVSVATANRFARALELPGYPQFRAELARGFEAALEPVEKLRTELAHSASAVQIFAATLEEDIRNAQRNLQGLTPRPASRPSTSSWAPIASSSSVSAPAASWPACCNAACACTCTRSSRSPAPAAYPTPPARCRA